LLIDIRFSGVPPLANPRVLSASGDRTLVPESAEASSMTIRAEGATPRGVSRVGGSGATRPGVRGPGASRRTFKSTAGESEAARCVGGDWTVPLRAAVLDASGNPDEPTASEGVRTGGTERNALETGGVSRGSRAAAVSARAVRN
jgi:hypothetical protein